MDAYLEGTVFFWCAQQDAFSLIKERFLLLKDAAKIVTEAEKADVPQSLFMKREAGGEFMPMSCKGRSFHKGRKEILQWLLLGRR